MSNGIASIASDVGAKPRTFGKSMGKKPGFFGRAFRAIKSGATKAYELEKKAEPYAKKVYGFGKKGFEIGIASYNKEYNFSKRRIKDHFSEGRDRLTRHYTEGRKRVHSHYKRYSGRY